MVSAFSLFPLSPGTLSLCSYRRRRRQWRTQEGTRKKLNRTLSSQEQGQKWLCSSTTEGNRLDSLSNPLTTMTFFFFFFSASTRPPQGTVERPRDVINRPEFLLAAVLSPREQRESGGNSQFHPPQRERDALSSSSQIYGPCERGPDFHICEGQRK